LDGPTLLEYLTDPDTGEIVPITVVTDNGGPFRSLRFGAFITARPELRHIRTRVRTPGQNGVRDRAFQSLNYEHLYRQIDDALDPSREAETFCVDSTQSDHTKRCPGTGQPMSTRAERTRRHPRFPSPTTCQVLEAGQVHVAASARRPSRRHGGSTAETGVGRPLNGRTAQGRR